MPIGHLVHLIWRWKSWLVYLGAGLIAASVPIIVGISEHRAAMEAIMPANAWYILSALLAPVGYVVQDTVADAMTVEAVQRVNAAGNSFPEEQRVLMQTTMQTLGRVAIIGGSVLVGFISLYMLSGVQDLLQAQKAAVYRDVYLAALSIPAISVLGVFVAALLRGRDRRRLMRQGFSAEEERVRLTGAEDTRRRTGGSSAAAPCSSSSPCRSVSRIWRTTRPFDSTLPARTFTEAACADTPRCA